MVVFMRRRQLAMAAAGVLAALALLLIVPGCQRGGGKTEPVKAADNAARVAYLEGLGWQVTPEPLETLSLLLPEDLSGHTEYTALQKDLGLPFDQCGGKTATRYTYTVLNYPDIPQGGPGQPVRLRRPGHSRGHHIPGAGRLSPKPAIP